MLTWSNVNFLDSSHELEIEFKTETLEKDFLGFIVSKNSEAKFVFDTQKLKLVYPDEKRKMALLYNVDLECDEQVGWVTFQTCLTSEKLGFIISPMSEWHRERVIKLYSAIVRNTYKANLDLSCLKKGNIYLHIEYWSL